MRYTELSPDRFKQFWEGLSLLPVASTTSSQTALFTYRQDNHWAQAAIHGALSAEVAVTLVVLVAPAFADEGAPDKSSFTLFDPTPDADLRTFNKDRPPKADSPYTVDAGHFQFEMDLPVFGSGNTNGIITWYIMSGVGSFLPTIHRW